MRMMNENMKIMKERKNNIEKNGNAFTNVNVKVKEI